MRASEKASRPISPSRFSTFPTRLSRHPKRKAALPTTWPVRCGSSLRLLPAAISGAKLSQIIDGDRGGRIADTEMCSYFDSGFDSETHYPMTDKTIPSEPHQGPTAPAYAEFMQLRA